MSTFTPKQVRWKVLWIKADDPDTIYYSYGPRTDTAFWNLGEAEDVVRALSRQHDIKRVWLAIDPDVP